MSKTSIAEDEAARILFNACTEAQHTFDQSTRREALGRIVDGIKAGLSPKDAAISVAGFFLLNPEWDGGEGKLKIAP